MGRLPTPGGDDGVWGDVLNDYLGVEHTATGALKIRTDGTLNKSAVGLGNVDNTSDASKPVSTATQTALDAIAQTLTANTQTSSYILAMSDAGKVVEMNSGSATTVTVPPNTDVAFPAGTVIEVFRLGSGTVTVQAGSGVTILSRSSLLGIGNRYGSASLRKRATNEWVLVGDLA